MMSRSAPPFSMNLALIPVPAPAAIMGCPLRNVERSLSMTSLRLYGFPLPVHGFGIWPMTLAGSLADRNDPPFGAPSLVGRKAHVFFVPDLVSLKAEVATKSIVGNLCLHKDLT